MSRALDNAYEALVAILARPGRAILISVGTVVGIAAIITTMGLASTARAQIGAQFNALTATEDSVAPANHSAASLPPDAESLASRIDGVKAAGRFWEVPVRDDTWRSSWSDEGEDGGNLYAADPSALPVLGPTMTSGRVLTNWDRDHAPMSVMLSKSLARQLGIARIGSPTFVFLGDAPLLVVGIYSGALREPQVLLGAIVTVRTAEMLYGTNAAVEPRIVVETRVGSANVVAEQLSVALRPDHPAALLAVSPPNSTFLRRSIDADVQRLLVMLGIVLLAIGLLSIANGMLVAVLERVPEVGLRRALGARRSDIAAQFLWEGATIGTVGGFLGFAFGVIAIVTLSAAYGWTPTVDLYTIAPMVIAGTITGVVASVYPAWKAASTPPVRALQR
jgi:putative ABC transport system permease protein